MKPAYLILVLLVTLLTACGTSGQFTIKSEPAGADVFLDGTLMGKTPATLKIPFPENQQMVMEKKIISLRLKGYKEIKEVLCYQGDSCKILNFKLTPEP